MKSLIEQEAELRTKLRASPLANHPRLNDLHAAFERKVELTDRMQALTRMRHKDIDVFNDLRAMRRLLRRLNYVGEDGVVTMKGRLACEITSSDEVLLTECIFRNVFDGLTADNIIAL